MSDNQYPLFGRKYQIQVTIPSASGEQQVITVTDSSFEPEALRVTFDIYQRAFQIFWYAEVDIYNLDEALTLQLLGPNMQQLQVTISAGYLNGNYATIWSGPVFQTLFERVDAIDFKITLHCILGLSEITRNNTNFTLAAQLNQTEIVNQIAQNSFNKIPVDKISSTLSPKKLPRAKTVFGSPGKYLSQIAEDNTMQWWLSHKGLAMGGFNDDDIPTEPSVTFAPPLIPVPNTAAPAPTTVSNGVIIGTPQQTQYGVSFRALLDPRVQVNKPFMVVKIDNTQIRKQKLLLDPNQQGPARILPVLDADGTYIVGGVRFIGDTRGDDWYVEVEGYSTYIAKQHLLQAIMAS